MIQLDWYPQSVLWRARKMPNCPKFTPRQASATENCFLHYPISSCKNIYEQNNKLGFRQTCLMIHILSWIFAFSPKYQLGVLFIPTKNILYKYVKTLLLAHLTSELKICFNIWISAIPLHSHKLSIIVHCFPLTSRLQKLITKYPEFWWATEGVPCRGLSAPRVGRMPLV